MLRKRVSVEVGAAEEVTAGAADELAAAVFKAGGAGGAEALVVVLRFERADFGGLFGGVRLGVG
jgi:hypothetical protein